VGAWASRHSGEAVLLAPMWNMESPCTWRADFLVLSSFAWCLWANKPGAYVSSGTCGSSGDLGPACVQEHWYCAGLLLKVLENKASGVCTFWSRAPRLLVCWGVDFLALSRAVLQMGCCKIGENKAGVCVPSVT
jgi:hypothetical protein